MPVIQLNKTRGGLRSGAGRKKGSSAYGESTKAIRVPESLIPTVQVLLSRQKMRFEDMAWNYPVFYPKPNPSHVSLPLFMGKVSAGFPSPADDFVEKTLDLNELLIQNPPATFFTRVQGHSMIGAGIHPDDILVVDRSLEPADGKIVICAVNGELTVKRLIREDQQWFLKAENAEYPNIPLHEDLDIVIWGVVTRVIHSL